MPWCVTRTFWSDSTATVPSFVNVGRLCVDCTPTSRRTWNSCWITPSTLTLPPRQNDRWAQSPLRTEVSRGPQSRRRGRQTAPVEVTTEAHQQERWVPMGTAVIKTANSFLVIAFSPPHLRYINTGLWMAWVPNLSELTIPNAEGGAPTGNRTHAAANPCRSLQIYTRQGWNLAFAAAHA